MQAGEVADEVAARQPDNLAARNLQAVVATHQGDRQRGRGILEAILAQNPTYRPARINLVKLDIIEGNYTAADEVLTDLLSADPDDQLALRESAEVAAARGDRRTAIQRLERIRQINPRAARPILELASLYLSENRPGDALKVAQALEREVPDNLMVKKGLAMVQLLRDELPLAQSLLEDAARLAGRDVEELTAVAKLQVRAGALEAAEANFRKALEQQPDSVAARLELAALLTFQHRYDHAASEIDLVLSKEPDSLTAIAQLGDIRLAQGRAGEAIDLYRRAQTRSEQPELMVKLHRALVRAGRAEQALEELQAWNEVRPDSPSVMLVLADRLQQKGDNEAALSLYLRLADLQPQSAIVHNNLANLLMPVDAERALAAAMRAHELAPDNAAVLDTLGWVLVQLGDLERGLIHLREAVIRNSRSPTLRYHLAVALEEYGNKTEARRALRRALAMKAPFQEREQARARLERLQIR